MAPRHHYQHFPPRSLRDLYWEDMQALTPLFRPVPMPRSPAYAAWQSHLRSRIVDLPSHLRRKPDDAAATAFCATHKNLNPAPIESLLHFLRHILRPDQLKAYDLSGRTFGLLVDMRVTFGERAPPPPLSSSSASPSASRGKTFAPLLDVSYGRVAANFVEDDDNDSCAACKLSSIADDGEGLAVLGAFAIASIASKHWKASKRVQFIESFYAAVVGPSGAAIEEVTVPMWELAIELYHCRPPRASKAGDGPDRSHVDAAVAAASISGSARGRGTRCPLFASSDPFADDRAARTPTQSRFQTPNAPRAASSYSHMDSWRSYEQSVISPVSPSWRHSSRGQRCDVEAAASSIYSHGEAEQSDGESFIDSYRRRRE